ncbi:hypothetical protein BKA70DRAFT_1225361 [Coprinopsis sp. MPI-PUGE-AT-0042]|nr:hypothetical protein BKA70DRAFT_1225361 [Coprinopsis sp. MPI-PUGE-AT-0042]
MAKVPKLYKASKPTALVGRRSSLMNKEQVIGANEMRDIYVAYSDSLSPHLPENQRTSLLTTKFDDLFDELFATPAFETASVKGDPKRNTAAWSEKLKKKLSNYMSRRNLARRAASSAQSISNGSAPASPPGPLSTVSPETLTAIRRARLLLRGEFPPREVFIFKEKDAIAAEVERLKDEGTDLVGGVLLNHAIKLLWTDEKKAEYADQVDPTSEDIDANQELFSSLLTKALADILTRGLLGTALIKVSIATQNETGDLTTTIFYKGFDAATSEPIAYSPLAEDGGDWQIEANSIIPRFKFPMPELPLDNDGLPLWPSISIHETSITQLASIVSHYIDAVWFHAVPHSATNPCFPTTEFANDPSKFLDTNKFGIPTSIPPALDDIVKLARYFESTSRTGVPFHFLPTSKIAQFYPAARGDDHGSVGTGEEASLAHALGIFDPETMPPAEVDAASKSQVFTETIASKPPPANIEALNAPQPSGDCASSAQPPPVEIDSEVTQQSQPVINANADRPPHARMGADAPPPQPSLPTIQAASAPQVPTTALGGTAQAPLPSMTTSVMDPLDALVAAAAAAALAPTVLVETPAQPPPSNVHFAGGLDALVAAAAAAASAPLPISAVTPVVQSTEIPAVEPSLSRFHGPISPPPLATLSQAPAPKELQVLQTKRQTRSSMRSVSSSSSTHGKKLPSQPTRDPPTELKRKRPNYTWLCPITGKLIEDDELPDGARPTKKPKGTSSTFKENTLQGSESTKRHGRKSKK